MQYELERSTDDMKWCVVLTILCANVLRLQNVVFRGGHCVTCPHPHSFPVPRRRLSVSTHTMAGKSLNSCVFCQICGDNPSGTELLYSSDELVVFKDIKPAAKHHYLVVSREHIPDARAMSSAHKPLLEKMLAAADQVLREQGGDPADVRLGFHWPPFHSVSHLHLHVISPTADMGLIARMIFKQNSWWFVSPEYVMSRL
ncbi:adenosine 5'-monophosphoramidase HINT3-like [Frankliniella occidentalis]|uniref:Adenosine 5'-monophosphoramidase HINT3 n=1 Tax=Frankliniella occidentalis TaxID=133901 RepID=A0A6J1S452_FRAOC|nr:adenosine 5'-monophosphoramidase HINT3-like [Frankliniella occidentalis]